MAGFGGDPGLALFGGLVEGFNKRREEDRATERQNVINEYSRKQMEQMEFNQRMRAEQVASQQAAAAAEAEAAEEQRVAQQEGLASLREQAAEISGLPAEQIAVMSPEQLQGVVAPPEAEKAPDPMNDLDRARARDLNAGAALEEDELQRREAMSAFLNSPHGKNLDTVLMNGELDPEIKKRAVLAAATGAALAGYDRELIEEYVKSYSPEGGKDDEDEGPEFNRDDARTDVSTEWVRRNIPTAIAQAQQFAPEGVVVSPQDAARDLIEFLGTQPNNPVTAARIDKLQKFLEGRVTFDIGGTDDGGDGDG